MATHDYVIANGTGSAVRADLNNALAAIVSNNSGSSEPATTYAYQWWADTTANVLKIRNSANNAWITLRELDGTMLMEDGSNSAPGLSFASDTNTGFFSGGADKIGFATGGVERLEIGSSEVVFNDPSNDVDFRVESNGNTHMLFVDAGNDRIGIGTSSPSRKLHIVPSGSDAYDAVQVGDGLYIGNTSNNVNAAIFHQGGGADLEIGSQQHITFTTGNVAGSASERARIDSSGRLLVGTSSAISGSSTNDNLQLVNSAGSILSIASSDTTIGNGTRIGEIEFWGQANSTWGKFAGISAFGDGSAGGVNGNPGRLVFYTEQAGSDGGPVERLRIDSSGNVGIATSSISGANLVIATNSEGGSGIKLIGKSANGGAEIDFRNNADDTLNGFIEFQDTGGILSTVVNQPQVFRTNNTERMRLDSSGRLLINHTADTSPVGYEAKLQLCDTSYQGSSLSIRRDGGASGPVLIFTKSRGTTKGANTIVQDGDNVGTIRFFAADGTDANSEVAQIRTQIDGTPGSNDTPGRLIFKTAADGASDVSERMRIHSSGRVSMAHDGSYYNAGASLAVSASINETVQTIRNTNASLTNSLIFGYVSRTSNSAFQYIKLAANNAGDNDFILRGDGNAYADGSWNAGGADYAEYFEWSDGNTESEDRRGISVVLDGDKIREAVTGEEPIGVISGNPSVVGDADIDRWKGKYLRDDFGTYLLDTHNVVEWDETITDNEGNQSTKKHSYEDWNIPDGIVVPDDAVVSATDENGQPYMHRRLNPDYNPETAYVSREDRPEWDTVGMMGKLRIRKGQVIGTRWIKMRDVSDTVEEWLVR